jgi:hypothetical protein
MTGNQTEDATATRLFSGPPPLPPKFHYSPADRWLATCMAVFGGLVFLVACFLHPYDSDGDPLTHGTHRQLGLPPCTLRSVTGVPCPSCGMTTSISLLLHGDLAAAWRANWAGVFVGVIGGAATVWLGFLAATGGRLTGWSAEKTIVRVFGVGAFVALLRYALLAAEWLIAG